MMKYLLIALVLIPAFWSAYVLQLVTFIPQLGLYPIHRFELKRWPPRLVALSALTALLIFYPVDWLSIVVCVFASFFLFLSFFIDNTKAFRDLFEYEMISEKEPSCDTNTQVLGIELSNGEGVCYPIEDLVIPRHLLNEKIGDEAFLISYCAGCRSCIVYNPVVDGMRLTFQVAAVWRRNMIMRDRETGSLWQQAIGKCVYGKLKGKELTMLMSQQMSFKDWKSVYPGTYLRTAAPDAPKSRLPKKMLMKMLKVTNKFMGAGFTNIGNELPAREKIFGLSLNGVSKAYPISELSKVGQLQDTIGDVSIEIIYDKNTNRIKGTNLSTQAPLCLESHWWFGWKEFHPYTEIWKQEAILTKAE